MPYSQHLCLHSQRALEILSKRWAGLIIMTLIKGGPQRFSELSGRAEVISDRMLSERLKELEHEGIVERRVIPDMPVRVVYALTEKGAALEDVMLALETWSLRWIPESENFPDEEPRT